MLTTAPIAYFAYKRLDHVIKSLESLLQCEGADKSELIIFSDGPKRPEDEKGVEEVRKVLRSKSWCGKVTIIERETNYGCAQNIISGVTDVCDSYGKVIVVEDDHVLSPNFLNYMNESLVKYEPYEQVMQISGYMFPFNLEVDADAVLLPFTTSWGWATWKRAWDKFDPNAIQNNTIKQNWKTFIKFNLNNSYPYFEMLEAQLNGDIDSWAIGFYYTVFMNNGLVLHPKISLIQNIGFDGSGTHCTSDTLQEQMIISFKVERHPDAVAEDIRAKRQVFRYLYLKDRKISIFKRLLFDMNSYFLS